MLLFAIDTFYKVEQVCPNRLKFVTYRDCFEAFCKQGYKLPQKKQKLPVIQEKATLFGVTQIAVTDQTADEICNRVWMDFAPLLLCPLYSLVHTYFCKLKLDTEYIGYFVYL